MTNAEIMQWAARTNYVHITVTPTCVIRPGQEQWKQRLEELTPDERSALVTKITRQEARLLAEHDANRQSSALQRIAKEDSTPAPRRPAGRRSSK
jgi:esterase/lipase superfamily enzyme